MQFTLSALGQEITWSGQTGVTGALEDALRAAHAILEEDPSCEGVEIFAEGRFLRDIERRPN